MPATGAHGCSATKQAAKVPYAVCAVCTQCAMKLVGGAAEHQQAGHCKLCVLCCVVVTSCHYRVMSCWQLSSGEGHTSTPSLSHAAAVGLEQRWPTAIKEGHSGLYVHVT